MRIKKIQINGYDVFLYQTKKYATMHMRFLFETPYTKRELFLGDLLNEYMMASSLNYKTRKELSDRSMELYSTTVSIHNFHVGIKAFTQAICSFYDPELVGDDYLKEALEYARDIILCPNFKEGKLNSDELNRCKTALTASIGNALLDYRFKESISFTKSVYPDSHLTISSVENKEEYVNLIKEFTDKDFIDLHDKIFRRSIVGLVLVGNFKEKHLKEIEDLFKFKEIKKLDEDYQQKLKISKKTPYFTKVSDSQCEESILRVLYACPARGLKKRLAYHMISLMLGNSGMILHKVLRSEMELVYSTDAAYDKHQDIMYLRAHIDKDNLEKAEHGFDEALRRLESRELIENLLKKIKEENELYLYTFDEQKRNPIREVFNLAFNFDKSTKKLIKIMDTITVDDILNALKDMKKMKIHFYEGTKK